jgi:succinyl-CoA synthetase beta subunit
VQVTAPSIEAARAALNAAVEYEWLSGGLSEDAMTRLAEVVAGIWQVGPDWRFSEWEVNPLLVGEDGSPAIVDGVGFSL